MLWWRGLTSISGPANPARRRLRSSTAPIEWWRGVAPISATEAGWNSLSRLRIDIALLSPGLRAPAMRWINAAGNARAQAAFARTGEAAAEELRKWRHNPCGRRAP